MDLTGRVRGGEPLPVLAGEQQVDRLPGACRGNRGRDTLSREAAGFREAATNSPDLGLRVERYLHSDWLRATTTTEEWPEAAKSLEESGEKQSRCTEQRLLGNLDTWKETDQSDASFLWTQRSLLKSESQHTY